MAEDASIGAADWAPEARARLRRIVARKSLIRGKEIQLASGRRSNFYVNMKLTAFDPEGADLIAGLILHALRDDEVDFVGGLEMGAVPLVACVAQKSLQARTKPIPGFFVRKQAKAHGTRKLLEGLGDDTSLAGRRVVLLDDVTTTAGSVLKAVQAARDEGALVDIVVTVVDRCEGAEENLAAQGVRLVALLTARDFDL